jgi:large subunit ribosomal protein L22e
VQHATSEYGESSAGAWQPLECTCKGIRAARAHMCSNMLASYLLLYLYSSLHQQQKGKKAKAKSAKFTVDCKVPVADSVLDPANFEKFLHDRIKVNGKAGDLGEVVTISREGAKLVVTAQLPFSKRYLKYLTKKYLKKQSCAWWPPSLTCTSCATSLSTTRRSQLALRRRTVSL